MGGDLESRCVGRVYGADGAVRVARIVHTSETLETTYQTARCHDPDHVQNNPLCKKMAYLYRYAPHKDVSVIDGTHIR